MIERAEEGAQMAEPALKQGTQVVLESADLQQLIDVLWRKGYRVVGPTVRNGVVVYDELKSTADLPAGWTDQQEGATYRLKRTGVKRSSITASVRIR